MCRVSHILFSVCSVWTEKYLKMIKTFSPTVEPKTSMIMMAAVVNFSLLRIPSIFHWYVWAGLYKCTLNAPQKWDWVHWATEHCIQLTWGLWMYDDIAMKGQIPSQIKAKLIVENGQKSAKWTETEYDTDRSSYCHWVWRLTTVILCLQTPIIMTRYMHSPSIQGECGGGGGGN